MESQTCALDQWDSILLLPPGVPPWPDLHDSALFKSEKSLDHKNFNILKS